MEYKMIEKLKDKLCDELEKVSRKESMNTTDLDAIYKLTDAIKNLGRIEEMEDGGYSQGMYSRRGYGRDGMWNANGSYARGNSYGSYADGYDGNSYANRGEHYVRGHYSRGDGLKDELRKMMDEQGMSSNDRMILEKAMKIIE